MPNTDLEPGVGQSAAHVGLDVDQLAQATEALGRSRGGFTTKLQTSCDDKGRPFASVLTPGEAHDVKGFGPLFRMICDKARALLVDRGYDADAIREEIAFHGV